MIGGQESTRSTAASRRAVPPRRQGGPAGQSRTGDAAHEGDRWQRGGSKPEGARLFQRPSLAVAEHGDSPQAGRLCRNRRGLCASQDPRRRPWRDQVATVGLDKRREGRAGCWPRAVGLLPRRHVRLGRGPSPASSATTTSCCVDDAMALSSPCIVLVVGGLPQYSRPGSAPSKNIINARAQVDDGIAEMMEYARQAKMPLAIEPLHPAYAADRACVNTTEQALDICDRLDPNRTGMLGVALDVYHIWWDPGAPCPRSRAQGAGSSARVPRLRLVVPTKDILNDRGMMGDGVIDIKSASRGCRGAGLRRLFRDRDLLGRTGGANRWTRC